MSSNHFPIDGQSVALSRLNINEFSTNAGYRIQWGLYLRAQIKLQEFKPDDPFGYHGLAAIHGEPVKTWPEGKLVPGKGYYCAHSRHAKGTRSKLCTIYADSYRPAFLTWHRAYLLLFEKRVVDEAVKLARLAPANLRADYEAEAYKIRLPYWDWGHISALPLALRNPDVQIIIPEVHLTNPTTIRNPLYSYKNVVVPKLNLETTREVPDRMDELMANQKLGTKVYHDLTHQQGYGPFSNTGYGAQADSIEQPHNFVHVTVGGPNGEMTDDAVAAYDPVFCHGSIDRYYALWQVLHPEKFYEENKPTHDTVDNILAPFYRSDPHGWWTGRMMQRTAGKPIPNTYDYGVQYPETLKSYTEAERLQAVETAVDTLYKPPAITAINGLIPINLLLDLPDYPDFLPVDTTIRREWRVEISVRKDLMDGNFGIFLFLGDAGDDTREWGTRVIDAGSFMTFKGPLASCPNCQETKEQWIYGSVYLTDHIYDLMQHQSLSGRTPDIDRILAEAGRADKRVLADWLKKHLDWRIRRVDGTEFVPTTKDLPKLRVEIESFLEAYNPLPPAGKSVDVDKQFGVTFDHTRHLDITAGKAAKGGASTVLPVNE